MELATVIDGSVGYGQMLRSSIALSALTLKPIKVTNIRKSRCRPGLLAQHLTGAETAAEFCRAETKGLELGSTEVEFYPKRIEIPSHKRIDIGTAGNIALLLQTLTPLLVFAGKDVALEIIGGTDVKWGPTVSYFQNVFCHFLERMGADIHAEVLKHGFFPRGGGLVKVVYKPAKNLNSLVLTERGKLKGINAISIASEQLAKAKVAERQVEGLENVLKDVEANVQYVPSASIGSSVFAFAEFENCRLAASAIGERGIPAEKVGEEAGKSLQKSIEANACFDEFMSDQIIPFMALAEGRSEVLVPEITQHVKTNILVCEQLLGVKFKTEGKRISVDGIGFKR